MSATSILAPVPARTLRDHVVERLRDAILDGGLPPGTPLVETQLAHQLGVSRGPLREAIRELIQQGLLQHVPYSGTSVIQLTEREIDEIYSMRTVLETFAFELAWDRRDAGFHREIDARHAALLAAIADGDGKGAIDAELHLHSLVYETAGHTLLTQSWRSLATRLHLYFAMHQRAHGRRGPKREAHETYVTLAKGDDLAAMREHVRAHMRQGLDGVVRFVRDSKG